MSATVKDVMTTSVVAVREQASYQELAAQLLIHRVSAFPVIDDLGKVTGVVSEAGLLVKEAGLDDRAGPPAGQRRSTSISPAPTCIGRSSRSRSRTWC